MKTILAVDDETSIRESYRVILSDEYRVLLAEDGRAALNLIDESHVDLVLLDMMMPKLDGFGVLEELNKRGVQTPVIFVTALKSVSDAVTAIKRGAREYMIKPFDVDELLHAVSKTLKDHQNEQKLEALREQDASGFDAIIGDSPALKACIDMAKRAMQVDSTVLITGESGTGKDLLARAIHSGSSRSNEDMVPVSCCAIPDTLVESELFGHERGAFTGATEKRIGKVQVADKGTLFLDEIGEMPMDAQSKLLRVLQNGQIFPVGSSKVIEVDVRFICATNRDLQEEVKAGRFREDLFYRVNVLNLELPPLRRRREDIPLLVEAFVAKHRLQINSTIESVSPDAMAQMTAYEWPGNIRELENFVERLLVLHPNETEVLPEHLVGILRPSAGPEPDALGDLDGLGLEEATARLERRLIQRALERSDGVQSKAAELLHTTRRILKYKMDQLDIES